MSSLEGKTAIVTGAAVGIGEAVAVALAGAGARVTVADVAEQDGAETVAEIERRGGTAFFKKTDVGSTREIDHLIASHVQRFGRLDVLVNNAAIALPGSAVELREETWDSVINVNLTSVWRGIKFAVPHMIEAGGGSIVNIASVQALVGFAGWAAYAASKGGVIALTQQCAVEYAPYGVRINAVAPGTILTPMNERIVAESRDPDRLIASWNAQHPLGRLGRPDEIAAAVLFLASDAASFVTGECLRADGGLVVKGPDGR
jgi:NAD(P)-dependent dehydrogenase (short-subunit alcohol dehydrogenase family)